MVKVSIGVPVYNVETYLRECLDSIMNQTFKDFEVIMVDDGSTDNSFMICQEYVARDNRFKLFHQENKGNGGARNTCLKYMHGEFITWIDSDDVVDNNYLERLLEVQAETGADIVRCSKKHIRGNNIFLITTYDRIYKTKEKIIEVSKLDLILDAIDYRLLVIEFWGTLIHRELYNGITFSQGVVFEDQGNKFKLYLRSKKNVILLEQLYSYRIREGSTMHNMMNKDLSALKAYIYNWDKLLYYIEVANYNVREVREVYIKELDKLSAEVNLSQEDTRIYRETINRHKQKISKLL
ncbi:glycosyltransferase family 2 protein [Ligilactobacillus salivarius]|uniref:glycosyltransferase family 2 protein n=1 Tax=Ligilactobacillus salivarius TaxID=1624 RepID=UPI002964DF33|nr:glycosyltransferase family 2 protein [Ligilactobacillus salivarius]WOX36707.1 glycosyltransferase family 2 protein [Ligilactobacillus salivarius]